MAKRKVEKHAEHVATETLSPVLPAMARALATWKEPTPCGLDQAPVGDQHSSQSGPKTDGRDRSPRGGGHGPPHDNRGARDIAKRALETTGQIFRYGIAHGYAKRNPATQIRPRDILKTTHKVNYARIEAKELPNLLRQIEIYPGTHVTRLAIKLMAFTFVRTGELVAAKWEEFDLASARWDIPAERIKMRTPHIVPLSRQTLDALADLRVLSGHSGWQFPGERNPARHMSNNAVLKGLERMGYKSQTTGHGFRGLASTLLHEQGYAHEHIELQLAHAPRNAVIAAYKHALHLKARAKMMQDWADFLEQTQRGAKVLQFREVVA